jgi:integrase
VLRLIDCAYALDERKYARGDYGLAVEMKLRTGARLGELLGCRYADIDFQNGVWTISAQGTKAAELN